MGPISPSHTLLDTNGSRSIESRGGGGPGRGGGSIASSILRVEKRAENLLLNRHVFDTAYAAMHARIRRKVITSAELTSFLHQSELLRACHDESALLICNTVSSETRSVLGVIEHVVSKMSIVLRTQRRLGFLYSGYTTSNPYFESVLMLFKVLMVRECGHTVCLVSLCDGLFVVVGWR